MFEAWLVVVFLLHSWYWNNHHWEIMSCALPYPWNNDSSFFFWRSGWNKSNFDWCAAVLMLLVSCILCFCLVTQRNVPFTVDVNVWKHWCPGCCFGGNLFSWYTMTNFATLDSLVASMVVSCCVPGHPEELAVHPRQALRVVWQGQRFHILLIALSVFEQ